MGKTLGERFDQLGAEARRLVAAGQRAAGLA